MIGPLAAAKALPGCTAVSRREGGQAIITYSGERVGHDAGCNVTVAVTEALAAALCATLMDTGRC